MNANDAPRSRLGFLQLVGPYAIAYLLGFPFQTVNALLAPALTADLAIETRELGLLSAVYFLAFGVCQLPVGMALDRFGPRRVEAILLLVAAGGALLFAVARNLETLLFARALIGVGVSASLMAPFKAFATRLPASRVPLANSLLFACGGLGALLATTPLSHALAHIGWRGVFIALAVTTLAASLLVARAAPVDASPAHQPPSLRTLASGVAEVLRSSAFRSVAPLVVAAQGAFIAVFGLWAGPWLRDVARFDESHVARVLFAMSLAMSAGYLVSGMLAARLTRRGHDPGVLFLCGIGAFLIAQAVLIFAPNLAPSSTWIAFAFFGPFSVLPYATLPRRFAPALAGRVVTALNLPLFVHAFLVQWLFGAIVQFAPSPMDGHRFAMSLCGGFQALALLVFVVRRERGLPVDSRSPEAARSPASSGTR